MFSNLHRSRSMTLWNIAFELLRDKFIKAGETKTTASDLASKHAQETIVPVINRSEKMMKKPAGQATNTEEVKMPPETVMCADKKKPVQCDAVYKYYRFDGKCNNLKPGNALLGFMCSPFRRYNKLLWCCCYRCNRCYRIVIVVIELLSLLSLL